MVKIPTKYSNDFIETILAENIRRLVISAVIMSLIEIGVFLTAIRHASVISIYQIVIILFNILMLPLLLILRNKINFTKFKIFMVYLMVIFHIIWAAIYTDASRTAYPDLDVLISPYMLIVYGAAVFIYMKPIWSLGVFSTSFIVFMVLLLFEQYSPLTIIGNIWNALALNLFAWITSYIIFAFRLRIFVDQKELKQAQLKSDALLLNIIPEKIVAELKETGNTTPEQFDQVTVLFSDLYNFTEISRQLTPDLLLAELNELFTAFDKIMEHYQCERIKTMGDAYLSVCGMPQPNPNHTELIAKSALAMVNYLEDRNKSHNLTWQIRIGIHSGSVIGGVVGVKKFIYDVFGDTINIAARVEQHSAPMKINVSETTYKLIKNKFSFVPRNPIQVKGIGQMQMYFLQLKTKDKDLKSY